MLLTLFTQMPTSRSAPEYSLNVVDRASFCGAAAQADQQAQHMATQQQAPHRSACQLDVAQLPYVRGLKRMSSCASTPRGQQAYHRAIGQLSHTSLAASWCLDSCHMCLTSDEPG